MKPFFLSLIALSIATLVRADDQTQSVQQALKDKGFYYGAVNGQPGPETDAAIKRYQIRQGLDVTGKLNAQTLSSLNSADNPQNDNTPQAASPPSDQPADTQPATPQTPSPEAVQSDRDLLRNQPQPATQPAAPDDQTQPPGQPQPPEAAQPLPSYVRFLSRTPYETAPPMVQQRTVQRAQVRLIREGFLRGVADGRLTDSFTRALIAYQRDAQIRPTGRLDMTTLAAMNLLPKPHPVGPPPIPSAPYSEPQPVYRGIWVH